MSGSLPGMTERSTLCLPDYKSGVALHAGDEGYGDELRRRFPAAESDASERLIELKRKLREDQDGNFWRILLEGLTSVIGSQFAFVAKRILVNDEGSAVEMPPYGTPGSCLMVEAFYYDDGFDTRDFVEKSMAQAYGAPCGHMRHDKVFLIPERFNDFITSNPNQLPFPADAYLAVPLFADGKCFAHFGVLWSPLGLRKRSLSWGYIEMILHALEDLVLQRLLDGDCFWKRGQQNAARSGKVIPHDVVLASQSVKIRARNLSHEMRTPMQGVVGMLDVMQATVQESMESQTNPQVKQIFQTLKHGIEVIQDSSRRAAEAADNVVQAYDLNMDAPDTPKSPVESDDEAQHGHADEERQRLTSVDVRAPSPLGRKRRWSHPEGLEDASAAKYRAVEAQPASRRWEEHALGLEPPTRDVSHVTTTARENGGKAYVTPPRAPPGLENTPRSGLMSHRPSTPTRKHSRIRDVVHSAVNDCLQVGGRPDSKVVVPTNDGEHVEVRLTTSRGDVLTKVIDWAVGADVPEVIPVDDQDLTKLVSSVFLNALKFTESGNIFMTVGLSPNFRNVLVNVRDTGRGIPKDFLPHLFKPFSREDDSLTRKQDGLGLGLMVGRGLARKMGGDLVCKRSDMSGPNRGSEFELRLPLRHLNLNVTPAASPARTPSPTFSVSFEAAGAVTSRRMSNTPEPRDQSSASGNVSGPRPFELKENTRSSNVAPATEPDTPHQPRRSSLTPLLPSTQVVISQPPPSTKGGSKIDLDRTLGARHPLTFLVAEDNKINRKLLVMMLSKLGYNDVHEAHDGAEAVRQMQVVRDKAIDVVLMDLWMPCMDGFEAAATILAMPPQPAARAAASQVKILAVTADVTADASKRAAQAGMLGMMTKPFKIADLQRLILEHCLPRPR